MKHALSIQVITVALLTACTGNSSGKIVAPGIIDAEIITLKAPVAGTIEKINLQEGGTVSVQDPLLQLNSDKINNQIKELEINKKEIRVNRVKLRRKQQLMESTVTYLNRQVQRFKRLKKKKSISGEKLEAMELKLLEARTSGFEVQQSIKALDIQEEKLRVKADYLELIRKDHQVLAPVSGVILEKFISSGENVFPNTPLADILDISSLHVDIFIEEREIAGLKINQRAQIVVDGMEGRELYGKITHFGRKAEFSPKYIISEKERKSLLYLVKISIDKNTELFKVGMPVSVILHRMR